MKTAKRNREKAAVGAEAPHQSVQSAKRVADQIGGIPEYRKKVAALILKACALFGGQVVGVAR